MKQVSRYHPLLVTLHWVLAVLIIAELTLGFFGSRQRPTPTLRRLAFYGCTCPAEC
jgi:cytochrome b561